MNFKDLPKHPHQRELVCPVCKAEFTSIPVQRGKLVNDFSHIIEQHVCPAGHVYQTELGKDEMLGGLS